MLDAQEKLRKTRHVTIWRAKSENQASLPLSAVRKKTHPVRVWQYLARCSLWTRARVALSRTLYCQSVVLYRACSPSPFGLRQDINDLVNLSPRFKSVLGYLGLR
jgi:hypothetical protein